MRPAPRAASWLSKSQQPISHTTAVLETYQVAVAVNPSEGAQTFWPWMIVSPHFLKSVPDTEAVQSWLPSAASSVMHLAASADCDCLYQQLSEARDWHYTPYRSSFPAFGTIVSAANSTLLQDVGGNL